MTSRPDSARLQLLANPQIRLHGTVDHDMYDSFRSQLEACPDDGPIAIAITTLGGDPEVARAMGDDVRLLRENDDREILFLGKVAVYSAGATFMADFPVANRYMTEATRLLIHERSMTKTVQLDGPLKSLVAKVKQLQHQIEHAIIIENEGFKAIVKDSKVDFSEVEKRAPNNWYIECHEAKELGLIADVI